MAYRVSRETERGATLVEFAIGATLFLTVMFGVVELGRLFWTHNALRDAARRGTRYATVRKNDAAGQLAVKKVVVYGDPNANPGTATPIVPGLTTGNVTVNYKRFNGIELSSMATVSINNYNFQFAVPLVGNTVTLPSYRTTLPGESAGFVPCDLPSGAPPTDWKPYMKPCDILPN